MCTGSLLCMVHSLDNLFLLEEMKLVALHAKVAVIVEQSLCTRVGVVTGHDDHLQLHRLFMTF